MKNIFKSITILFVSVFLISCEEDPIIYTGGGAPPAISFAKESQVIGICQPTVPIGVEVTEAVDRDLTINLNINPESTALASEYTVGNTVVIPKGEYVANLDVTVDFTEVPDGASRELILDLVLPEGTTLNTRGSIIVSYSSACTENEVEFSFNLDDFPEEFAYQVLDATTQELIIGVLEFEEFEDVEAFSETVCLPDGDYLLVLFDSFGDGFCCDFGNGSADIILKSCDGDSNVVPTIGPEFGGQQLVVPFTL